MATGVILQQMIIIFILILSGFFLAKRNLVPPTVSKDISSIVICLTSPAMMISSALNADRNISNETLLLAFGVVAAIYIVLILTAEIIVKLVHADAGTQNAFRLMHIFSNVGFVGIPVINAVIGPEGVLFAVIMTIGYNLCFYTYGYYRMKQQSAPGEKVRLPLSKLVNVGMISGIISIVIYAANIRLPYMIAKSCEYIGSSTTFLTLFVIGVNVSQASLKKVFSDKQMYLFLFLKQVVTPLLCGYAMRPFVRNEVMFLTCVTLVALPVGSLTLMLAEKEGIDSTPFANGVIVSTILSVITIPLVLILV